MSIDVACLECSRVVAVPQSRARTFRYCSMTCRRAQRPVNPARRVEWACIACGATQLKRPSKARIRKFCSQACRDAHHVALQSLRKTVSRSCAQCGKTFETQPSRVACGRGKHCSRTCAALARPINGRPSQISVDAIATVRAASCLAFETELRVGRWSIDLAVPALMLAIEIDGEYWHSLPDMVERDRRKTADLVARGWDVRRVVVTKRATAQDVAVLIQTELSNIRKAS